MTTHSLGRNASPRNPFHLLIQQLPKSWCSQVSQNTGGSDFFSVASPDPSQGLQNRGLGFVKWAVKRSLIPHCLRMGCTPPLRRLISIVLGDSLHRLPHITANFVSIQHMVFTGRKSFRFIWRIKIKFFLLLKGTSDKMIVNPPLCLVITG